MDQRPNIRAKTTKLLGENIGEYLHDIQIASEFLNMMPKALATKEKTHKLKNHQIGKFCASKDTINKVKLLPTK